jgi:hypothetical protein
MGLRIGKWWRATTGLLTQEADPDGELAEAGESFPDEYLPMLFMTGDGHRNPPFAWAVRDLWWGVFGDIVEMDKLCCHVELFGDQVTQNSVPARLRPVYNRGKVFGWEPDFYRLVLKVMERALQMFANQDQGWTPKDVIWITSNIRAIGTLGYLRHRVQAAVTPHATALKTSKQRLTEKDLPGFARYLLAYQNDAMGLRTAINNVIGANIQRIVDRYPDHMHLITCGDAHITTNPLYGYVNPPVGTYGIADASRG